MMVVILGQILYLVRKLREWEREQHSLEKKLQDLEGEHISFTTVGGLRQLEFVRLALNQKLTEAMRAVLKATQYYQHKVSEGLAETEQNVEAVQQEVCDLCSLVANLQKLTARMNECVEDAKGRFQRNNLRFVDFPERLEGPYTKLFLED
ncbi:hypothetical protein NDU88_001110 [Pleurodeles waltl]|uniref:Uncharacterized protein n=1 Tax=Pleurodeles waltl TaxID=8319 RepID=A0AAV7U600_PLEWA|nr:hypothetical protein NDU88_001110 [Pleurodeles waltl]